MYQNAEANFVTNFSLDFRPALHQIRRAIRFGKITSWVWRIHDTDDKIKKIN
jgi:hypothetical protein